jgi:hypothetical protein
LAVSRSFEKCLDETQEKTCLRTAQKLIVGACFQASNIKVLKDGQQPPEIGQSRFQFVSKSGQDSLPAVENRHAEFQYLSGHADYSEAVQLRQQALGLLFVTPACL